MCVISEIQTEDLSLEFYCMFDLGQFEAGLITWYRLKIRTMTFSESGLYKNMLRKEYIQQKEKEIIYMGLVTFMPAVQFANI